MGFNCWDSQARGEKKSCHCLFLSAHFCYRQHSPGGSAIIPSLADGPLFRVPIVTCIRARYHGWSELLFSCHSGSWCWWHTRCRVASARVSALFLIDLSSYCS